MFVLARHLPYDFHRTDWLGKSSKGDGAEVVKAVVSSSANEHTHKLGPNDLAAFRVVAKTLRDDHGHAEVVALLTRRLTHTQADPHAHFPVFAVSILTLDCALDRDSRVDGVQCTPEDHHETVAQVLNILPTVSCHRPSQQPEVIAAQLFGGGIPDPLEQFRGTDEVGKEQGDCALGHRGFFPRSLRVAAGRRSSRRRERRVLREDPPLELAQAIPGLDSEVLNQSPACILIDPQSVGLSLAAVQGQHQLRPQTFPIGVLGDQRLELADHPGVPAEPELRFDQLLDRAHAYLLEARDFGLGKCLVGEVDQRCVVPQRERPFEDLHGRLGAARGQLALTFGAQALEPERIELLGTDPQLVAALVRHDQAVARTGRERAA